MLELDTVIISGAESGNLFVGPFHTGDSWPYDPARLRFNVMRPKFVSCDQTSDHD